MNMIYVKPVMSDPPNVSHPMVIVQNSPRDEWENFPTSQPTPSTRTVHSGASPSLRSQKEEDTGGSGVNIRCSAPPVITYL